MPKACGGGYQDGLPRLRNHRLSGSVASPPSTAAASAPAALNQAANQVAAEVAAWVG